MAKAPLIFCCETYAKLVPEENELPKWALCGCETGAMPTQHRGHRCQVVNLRSFLFDKRWEGADDVQIELQTSGHSNVMQVVGLVSRTFKKLGVEADVGPVSKDRVHLGEPHGALRISNVKVEGQMDEDQFVNLAKHCLWIESNRLSQLPAKDRRVTVADRTRFRQIITEEVDQNVLLAHLKGQKGQDTSSSKASRMLRRIFHVQKRLRSLLNSISLITRIQYCGACSRVLKVYGQPMVTTEERKKRQHELEDTIANAEAKLAKATGAKNKQKRKALQRKLKKLRAALEEIENQNRAGRGEAIAQFEMLTQAAEEVKIPDGEVDLKAGLSFLKSTLPRRQAKVDPNAVPVRFIGATGRVDVFKVRPELSLVALQSQVLGVTGIAPPQQRLLFARGKDGMLEAKMAVRVEKGIRAVTGTGEIKEVPKEAVMKDVFALTEVRASAETETTRPAESKSSAERTAPTS